MIFRFVQGTNILEDVSTEVKIVEPSKTRHVKQKKTKDDCGSLVLSLVFSEIMFCQLL